MWTLDGKILTDDEIFLDFCEHMEKRNQYLHGRLTFQECVEVYNERFDCEIGRYLN